MKKAISIITVILAIAFAGQVWGQGVKTGILNLGETGGSDANEQVTIDRTGSNMRLKDGSGTYLLSTLGAGGETSRTGIVKQSGFQGPSFVVLGDSNVRFGNSSLGERNLWGAWPHQAEIQTQSNPLLWGTNIYNHGVSGLNSENAIDQLDAAMKHLGADGATDPDFVILQLGGNDLIQASPISTTDMIDNITTMTNDILTSGSIPVIINIMDMLYGSFVSNAAITNNTELDDAIAQYNAVLKTFAEQNEFAFFDMHSLMMEATPSNRWYIEQDAGGVLHFSFAGQRRMATNMLNFLYDTGMIAANDNATHVEMIPYDNQNIVFSNQSNLTSATNAVFTFTDTSDIFGRFDYRHQDNSPTQADRKILEFVFNGTGVALVTGTGDFGQIIVTIDSGTPETVDLFRPGNGTAIGTESVFSDIPWYRRELDYSTHTLEVTLTDDHSSTSTTYQVWIQGVIVEHNAMESRLLDQNDTFPATIEAPSLVLIAPGIQEVTPTNIFEATGNGSQGAIFNDLDFSIMDDAGSNLFTTQDGDRDLGFRVTDPLFDIDALISDSFVLRTDGAAALQPAFQLTRDAFDDGDIVGIYCTESIAGVLTADAFGAIGFHAVDAATGFIDGEIIFSIAVDTTLTPVAYLDEKTARFSKPLWIEHADSGRTSPTAMLAWFETDASGNVYITTGNANAGGFFFADTNSDAQGGLFYNHATDELAISAAAANSILLDDTLMTVTYGDSGVTPTAETRLFVEDDTANDVAITIGTDNDDTGKLLFADDTDNDRGGVLYNHDVDEMTIRQNGVDTIIIGTASTEFNDTEADRDFIVNANSLSNAFTVNGANGHVGINDPANAATFYVKQITTTGVGAQVYRDLASGSTTHAVMSVFNDNAGDDQNALTIQNDGSGNAITATGKVYITTFTAIGVDPVALGMLHVEDTGFEGSVALFINSGDDSSNLGIDIQAGDADATTGGGATFARFFDGDGIGGTPTFGSITMAAGVMAFVDASDKKLKDIHGKSKRDARWIIEQANVVDFVWKEDSTLTTRTGLIAQEVEMYFPEAVLTMRLNEKSTTRTETVFVTSGTISTSHSIVVEEPIRTFKGLRRGDFIIPLIQETQRQQQEIELLWAAVIALTGAVLALIVVVRKIAIKVGLDPEQIAILDGLKEQVENTLNNLNKEENENV